MSPTLPSSQDASAPSEGKRAHKLLHHLLENHPNVPLADRKRLLDQLGEIIRLETLLSASKFDQATQTELVHVCHLFINLIQQHQLRAEMLHDFLPNLTPVLRLSPSPSPAP